MTSAQGILLVVGALFEFGGIVALAAPDLVPYRERASSWLGHRWRATVNPIRRLFGRPPLVKLIPVGASLEIRWSVRDGVVKEIAPRSILEEKVAWMLQRDLEAQTEMNSLADRVQDLEGEMQRLVARVRDDLRAQVASEIAGAGAQYRPLRVVGTVALALGLVCTTIANFV